MPPFKPPPSGNLPVRGKRILKRVYVKLRRQGHSPSFSAKRAWGAVRRAGFRKKSYAKKRRK